jgi:hypothetical protein
MNREQIIETMARALCECQQPSGAWERNESEGYRNIFRNEATAALSALEAAGLVVVPVEPTDAMCRAGKWALDHARERDGLLQEPRPYTAEQKHAIRYAAMINAAQENKP